LPNSIIIGEYPEEYIRRRAELKIPRWKYIESCWRNQLGLVQQIIESMHKANLPKTTILALVEDGLWEEVMWLPVKLFAETLWNPSRTTPEIISCIDRNE
jgi:hypothetical protein